MLILDYLVLGFSKNKFVAFRRYIIIANEITYYNEKLQNIALLITPLELIICLSSYLSLFGNYSGRLPNVLRYHRLPKTAD